MNSGKQQIVIKQNNFEELIRQKNYDLHQQKIEEIKKSQHSKKTMSMDARNMDILAFNRSQYKQLKMNESFMENNINKNNLMIFEKLKYISNRQSDYGMHQTPQANRKSSLQSQYAQNQKLKQNLALVKRIENVKPVINFEKMKKEQQFIDKLSQNIRKFQVVESQHSNQNVLYYIINGNKYFNISISTSKQKIKRANIFFF